MILSAMQPYLFPYLGYFSLLHQSDIFIIMDDVQYIRRGWSSRNNFIINNSIELLTCPTVRNKQSAKYKEIEISKNITQYDQYVSKLTSELSNNIFNDFPKNVFNEILQLKTDKLVDWSLYYINAANVYLGFDCKIIKASSVDRVYGNNPSEYMISLCKKFNCDVYINPANGLFLYESENFSGNGISLKGISYNPKILLQTHQYLSSLSLLANYKKQVIFDEIISYDLSVASS